MFLSTRDKIKPQYPETFSEERLGSVPGSLHSCLFMLPTCDNVAFFGLFLVRIVRPVA